MERPRSGRECDEITPAEPFADNLYSYHKFERESVLLNAPEASGVYGLYNVLWIYIGEAENIRQRLLEHLGGDNHCINHYRPSGFAFELAGLEQRIPRRLELVETLEPLCEGKAFTFAERGRRTRSTPPPELATRRESKTIKDARG
jgi:hypothetical protein